LSTRILHSSDIHGAYDQFIEAVVSGKTSDFDIWLDTGDFLPTYGRPIGQRVDWEKERHFQMQHVRYKKMGKKLVQMLRGRPALTVSGNHDFLNLAAVIQAAGGKAAAITPTGLTFAGRKWVGFPDVNYMKGEWPHETQDARKVVDTAFAANPNILATHSPPGGILDFDPISQQHIGLSILSTRLFYGKHRIKHHFFGHCHGDGGKTVEEAGIRFYNGSLNAIVHTVG
jgi:Icc-related predicted phosphoesterase